MSDSLMTILGIFIALILMFIYPLMSSASKNDEIAQTVAQTVVDDFILDVTTEGRISGNSYDKFIQRLYATGNSYDIQLEVQILDDNPQRATSTASKNLTGENKYYSVYTNTILDEVMNKGEYLLKKNDYIVVTVKNTNITILSL